MCVRLSLTSRVLLLSAILTSSINLAAADKPYFLDQYAPTQEELHTWAENYKAFLTFGSTPKFLNEAQTENQEKVRDVLLYRCPNRTFTECQSFIRSFRCAVRTALPDNPLYWKRFWTVVEAENMITLKQDWANELKTSVALMDAFYYAQYKDLAADGRVNVENAIRLMRAARNWRSGYQSGIDKQSSTAFQGIIRNYMSLALAEANRSRDNEQMHELAELLRPPNPDELSWGPQFWLEREVSLTALVELPANEQDVQDVFEADFSGMGLSELDAEQISNAITEDPMAWSKKGWDMIARHYDQEIQKSWSDFWSEGTNEIDNEHISHYPYHAIVGLTIAQPLTFHRESYFWLYLYPPLIDIYTGKASPGIPSRPAPDLWRWDWEESPQPRLCLVSNEFKINLSFKKSDGEYRLCIDYYDEKTVEALYFE